LKKFGRGFELEGIMRARNSDRQKTGKIPIDVDRRTQYGRNNDPLFSTSGIKA
jgi:ribosomal protein L13E